MKSRPSGRAAAGTLDSGMAGSRSLLLVLLGLLWSVRLAAIKSAGLAGIPAHVVVAVCALGIAILYSGMALSRRDWPPIDRATGGFYLLSGTIGFLAPFALESVVAPHLPVFVLVVVVTTMPVITLALSVLVGSERLRPRLVLAVGLGFVGAVLMLWDSARVPSSNDTTVWWVLAAFGVPMLYALNTVFIATRWPARAGALHVAHAQALVVAIAAVLGSLASGTMADWSSAALNLSAIGVVIVAEGLGLRVYLRITRDHGATYVALANYVSMVFAALIGTLLFGDRITWLAVVAAVGIGASVALHRERGRGV